ncbi:MAG TPA: bifunctional biotin--[acetyl-CoA-carboxylase] ligase/biotin operon repressor BirA [Gammaproteobacteria bacterium]|nr:bifunctional biotin--[acetyl-CoA-carboxylase] ligase/biotin operon repressor BirA [Gammaproteobacteria bacterium]
MLMSMRYRVMELLADGRFHSGEWLGKRLGISRAAVWKHVRALSGAGVGLHAVRGQGYRLASPYQPLQAQRILAELSAGSAARLQDIEILRSVDSTSDHLKRTRTQHDVHRVRACLAEYQSAGRGRRGRRWISPYGSSLYLSLAIPMDESGVRSGGLSLVAAVATLRALQACGVEELGLKWPNDIFYRERKLAGILLDLSGEAGGCYQVIMGIGINIRMPDNAAREIDQPWTDLSQCGAPVERNRLAGAVLDALLKAIAVFNEQGLDNFVRQWRRFDLIADRMVELRNENTVMAAGIARGVDRQGALLIETDGITQRYHAGEVSVRLVEAPVS